jgi:hypothetical protein
MACSVYKILDGCSDFFQYTNKKEAQVFFGFQKETKKIQAQK